VPYGKAYGKLPTRVDLPSKHPEVPGFKTVKIRYGPYKVPNMGITTRTPTGAEEGMLWNYPDTNIQKPCAGDCMIVGIIPDYETLDGKSVNVDTGRWMHHVSFASAPSTWRVLIISRLFCLILTRRLILPAQKEPNLSLIGLLASTLPLQSDSSPLVTRELRFVFLIWALPTLATK
jgi:hypothetical protein